MTAIRREVAVDRAEFPYKMRDLCEQTGLDRQTIHFYIQQGLVPEGQKTGRNMAYYSSAHLDRIRLVRSLAHERFLPLKAIRAVLEGQEEAFSPEQRALMSEVRLQVQSALRPSARSALVDAQEACERHGVSTDELQALVDVGLVSTSTRDGTPCVVDEDVWVLELWGRLRQAGFVEALGFTPADLAMYEEAMSRLVRLEAGLLARRVEGLSPGDAGAMLDRGLPLVNEFLTRLHTSRARQFLAAIE